ncbi:hypothetical protein [Pararhodobacter zhoushanensis]|uniref:Uncharacterized protein n=1 Tax=Pararhodobacter zhoushanensis TaxID=2479545 RepID=A0ABT3H1E5_9RHOB|nr:hypothetical protein [Pararhodobacter zhoushanensis]MCW1933586.1 hypothetical protein [Pararhodobacter zhoushanensis]
MGISTPKKPFDLKEFLSEKGKPRNVRRNFAMRGAASAAPAETAAEPEADVDTDAEPSTEAKPDATEK